MSLEMGGGGVSNCPVTNWKFVTGAVVGLNGTKELLSAG